MNALFFPSLLLGIVQGHGFISSPASQFYDLSNKTGYNAIATENIDSAFKGLKWNDSPDNNVKVFTSAFKKSKFSNLKQFFDNVITDCGNSRIDVSPASVDNINTMKWQNDEYKEGFIFSHSGPCEAWLDDIRVARSDDCRMSYPGYPAVIPIDYALCKGKCLLQFYWLALHEPNWQLYKQCVPVVRSKKELSLKPCMCKCNE